MLVAIITVLAIFIFTQFILSISYWDMKRKRKVYIRYGKVLRILLYSLLYGFD